MRIDLTRASQAPGHSTHCSHRSPTPAAVEIAELGRGVLLAAQLNARSNLTDLEARLPEFAESLRQVRDRLDAPVAGTAGTTGSAGNRVLLWARYEDLVVGIREPEFRRFLLPPPFAELRRAAAVGTVIMVNSGLLRSDAILIDSANDPVCVPLPDLSSSDVEANSRALLEQPLGDVRQILGWLWETVVKPVVEALPATGGPRRRYGCSRTRTLDRPRAPGVSSPSRLSTHPDGDLPSTLTEACELDTNHP